MNPVTKYPTKRLESWGKLKEVRHLRQRRLWESSQKGGITFFGLSSELMLALPYALGEDVHTPGFASQWTTLMQDHASASKYIDMAENIGVRDVCHSMKSHIGQMISGVATKGVKGGEIKPSFIFQTAWCHVCSFTARIFSEHYGLPLFVLDLPHHRNRKHQEEFLAVQMLEGLEWLEKITGREIDDERLAEVVRNEWESGVILSEMTKLQSVVPAPLTLMQLAGIKMSWLSCRYMTEFVEAYRIVLAEIKERAANGISGRGFEGARLLGGFQGPFPYQREIYPHIEKKYGAIFIGAGYLNTVGTPWRLEEEGWEPPPTIEELGWPFKSREDICRAFAAYHLRYTIAASNPMHYSSLMEKLVTGFKADAVTLMVDRGCKGFVNGILEVNTHLQSLGVPTLVFEGSQIDPRYTDLPRVLERMEIFVQALGYDPLQED